MNVFYAVFTLFVPVLMIICGIVMRKCHSDEPNDAMGYRTSRSMKNKDTWKFANELAGKLWIRFGIILTVISGIFSFICFYSNVKYGVWIMVSAMILQSAVMIATIYPVEKALKENFDDGGNRRKPI